MKMLKWIAGVVIFLIGLELYQYFNGYVQSEDVPFWKGLIGAIILFASTFALHWGGYFDKVGE